MYLSSLLVDHGYWQGYILRRIFSEVTRILDVLAGLWMGQVS